MDGLTLDDVHNTTADELNSTAQGPKYTAVSPKKTQRRGGHKGGSLYLRDWRNNIDDLPVQ